MPRFYLCLALMMAFLPAGKGYAQKTDVKELPDVKAALEQFRASDEKALRKLVKELQKAQDRATQENKLELAVSIRTLNEEIAAGDAVPFEDETVREAIAGSVWAWNNHWETTGVKVEFTEAEVLTGDGPNPTRQKYLVTGSRTIEYGKRKILFGEDFRRFVAILPGFNYRTGVRKKAPSPEPAEQAEVAKAGGASVGHYSESPLVVKALARYQASQAFARRRLVRKLEKAQKAAIQEKKLDEALAIQSFREKVKGGADPVSRDHPEFRKALNGTRYQWGRFFDRRFGIFINFSDSDLHWQEPGRDHRTPYQTVSSRELRTGRDRYLFSPDLKRFIFLQSNLELRTGICLNPQTINLAKASASQEPPKLNPGTSAGQEWRDNKLGMTFCWCPPGDFTMGSPPGEKDRRPNETQVQVKLTQGFWLGKHEVTHREWYEVMGTRPWRDQKYTRDGADFPVNYVTWSDAATFCEYLNARESQAGRLPEGWGYSLPTEAQWEYACRAGTTTAYSFGENPNELSECAWWGGVVGGGNTVNEQYPHSVGQKKPNAWGLHDMPGNVSEWCRDWYQETLPGGVDPEVTTTGQSRVIRVGSWSSAGSSSRSAFRSHRNPDARHDYLGFRVALVPRG